MEHKAFLSAWCRTFLHTKEKDVLFLNTLEVPLVPKPQEGPFHVMFVRKQQYSRTKTTKGVRLEPLVVEGYCAS